LVHDPDSLFQLCIAHGATGGRSSAPLFAAQGLTVSDGFAGMIEEQLTAPLQPLPTNVESRDFSDERARYSNALLNLPNHGMVATSDGYCKKGYAEATMRYCLDAASKATGF